MKNRLIPPVLLAVALHAGARTFAVIAPPKPGQCDFLDEFHPDTAQGRIVVR